jgi:hypothetical protein
MKLTKETLKRIIKEELDSVLFEESGKAEQVVDKAIELQNDPKAQKIFDKMRNDPEVQDALEKIKSELSLNERELESAPLTASGGMLGTIAMSMTPHLLKGTVAGKALMTALTPIIGGTAATFGAGAALFVAPIVIGYLIDSAMQGSADFKERKRIVNAMASEAAKKFGASDVRIVQYGKSDSGFDTLIEFTLEGESKILQIPKIAEAFDSNKTFKDLEDYGGPRRGLPR